MWNFMWKIQNGFLSHVPQKRADRKKDNFVSNGFQPPLMFCAGHVTRFFIQYHFIYKSEYNFFSQYSQVRVCLNFVTFVTRTSSSIVSLLSRILLHVPEKRTDRQKYHFVSNKFQPSSCSERVPHIITFCHMFRKKGLIVRKTTLWATNFIPLMFCATNFFIQNHFKCFF